jgi:hypothetical protein
MAPVRKGRGKIKAVPSIPAKVANAVSTTVIAAVDVVTIVADAAVSAVTIAAVINAPTAARPTARRVKPCQSLQGCTHFEASVSTGAFFISGARAPCLPRTSIRTSPHG